MQIAGIVMYVIPHLILSLFRLFDLFNLNHFLRLSRLKKKNKINKAGFILKVPTY